MMKTNTPHKVSVTALMALCATAFVLPAGARPVEKDVEEEPTEVTVILPEPEPEAVKEEKSEIDEMLGRAFPLPKYKALIELVQNWNAVPERAFPERITVNVALDYQISIKGGSSARKKTRLKAGHEAKPLKFQPGKLYVTPISDPQIKAWVPIDDTDFKARVEELYEKKVSEARARIMAQREKMRLELTASRDPKATPGPVGSSKTRNPPSTSIISGSYSNKSRGDYMPEIRNGKQKIYHDIPLGPIGGVASVPYGKREAVIRNLWDEGPGANSGLKEGDVIVEISGKKLKPHSYLMSEGPTGAPEMIGLAMIESQATGKPLKLTIRRGENEVPIAVELPKVPKFSETFPADCARSSALMEASGLWLGERQKDDGFWPSNDYSTAWCSLALLATGNPAYKTKIMKSARVLAGKYELGTNPTNAQLTEAVGGLDNWKHCMVGIFLAEYYLATGDEEVRVGLKTCCRRLEARIDRKTGRLGHSSTELPYSGNGLVIINTHAHLMWALASRIEGKKWNWRPWKLSYQAVEAAFCKNDAVGYSVASRVPVQAGARTGSMATALVLAERKSSTVRKMREWMKEHYQEFPDAHAMTSIGLIFGITGLKNTDKRGYRECMNDYRWMFSLVQPADLSHGSYYYGQKHNHGGDGYCDYRLVANYTTLMLLSSHRNDTLWMFGNRKRKWFD